MADLNPQTTLIRNRWESDNGDIEVMVDAVNLTPKAIGDLAAVMDAVETWAAAHLDGGDT